MTTYHFSVAVPHGCIWLLYFHFRRSRQVAAHDQNSSKRALELQPSEKRERPTLTESGQDHSERAKNSKFVRKKKS